MTTFEICAVTHSEGVLHKKKVAIICESMPKSINFSAIKRKLGRKTIVYRKQSVFHMNRHIIFTLLEDKPDIVIICVVINDVLNRFDQDQIINPFMHNVVKWPNIL